MEPKEPKTTRNHDGSWRVSHSTVRAICTVIIALVALVGLLGGLLASAKAYADKAVEVESRLVDVKLKAIHDRVEEKLNSIDGRLCRIEGAFGLEPKGGDE